MFVLWLVSIYVSVIDIQLWLKRHQKWFYFYIAVVIVVKLPIYGFDDVVQTFKCVFGIAVVVEPLSHSVPNIKGLDPIWINNLILFGINTLVSLTSGPSNPEFG
jgi:hypothetical protein